jgi:hypothetical protein
MFYKMYSQCEATYRKYALKQANRLGVRFIKYDIQAVFLKCAEILPTRLFDNKCHLIFWQNFLDIFSEFYMKPVARG